AGTYTGNVYVANPAANASQAQIDMLRAQDAMLLAQHGKTRADFKMKIGEAAAEDALGSYNMEIPIDDVSTFYSFSDVSHRNGAAAGFWRFPRQPAQTNDFFFNDTATTEIY